jgi:hypothetical protein
MDKTNFPKVYIAILSWNNYKDTRECLESLKNISYPNYKVIIVDNGSKDDSTKKNQQEFPEHVYIYLKENLGFSGGNNPAIEYALKQGADYILMLNNDTTVEPGFLNFLVEGSKTNEKIGITAPKMNYYYEPKMIWVAGGKISKIRGCGVAFGNKAKDGEKKYNIDKFITYVSGCCILVKREVFEKIGFWDELYYSYADDFDFCQKTINAGFKILYVAKSKIYHKIAVTNKKENPLSVTYYSARNRLYFSKKLLGIWFYVASFYFFVVHIPKFLIWLLKGKINEISATIDGTKDFLNNKMGRNRKYY